MNEQLLQGSAYPSDTGAADPALAAALAAYSHTRSAADEAGVLVALGQARLLVPVVAVLGEVEYDDQGLAHDKSSDMATVLLTGADGRRALLAFTSVAALESWQADARPVAVPASTAAASALQEGAAALLLDLSGPVTYELAGDDLVAVASGWTLAQVGDRTGWIRPPEE